MRERIILHLDMDYFFAQIEERENPHFKGKPVVVGADPKGGKGRGVVSTANYEARKYGIRSGLPISIAYKFCPDAIFLPVNMELYKKVSERIMMIIKKYSPVYEITSLDEAYLDLTNIVKNYEEAKEVGEKIKKEIFEKEKLTCTIGIGPNKTVAKLAAEKAKPNGLRVIKPKEAQKFLDPLDVEELPGIGPKTGEKLRNLGVSTIFQLRKISKSKLKKLFGKMGEVIWQRARGIDEESVKTKEKIKSVGRQVTFEKDTRNSRFIFAIFDKLLKEVYQEVIEHNFSFKTITVICRYQDFETHTLNKTLKEPSKNFEILKKESKKLLLKFFLKSKKLIRLIGLRLKISQ